MKVKICGIRSKDEAKNIISYNPDAIGLLVGFERYNAPNEIEPQKAKKITNYLNRTESPPDVYLLTDFEEIDAIYNNCIELGNSHVQLLGDIEPEAITELKGRLPRIGIVKVIPVTGQESINIAGKYDTCRDVDYLLLDSRTETMVGGTGITHDWRISKQIIRESNKPIWLAGGLNPGNLEEAIRATYISYGKPYGVDVETGIQLEREKDYGKVSQFISIARNFNHS